MSRRSALTSRIEHERVVRSQKIFTDTETVYRIVKRDGPITGLQIHVLTEIPHHEVFARLGDLRKANRIIDSDESAIICPRTREAHTCCANEFDAKPRLRKTYAVAPPSAQMVLTTIRSER